MPVTTPSQARPTRYHSSRWPAVDGVLADIQRVVEGELDEDERRRRIAELAESLQSEPPSVEQAISAAVARAAEAGTITKDEAQRFAKRF